MILLGEKILVSAFVFLCVLQRSISQDFLGSCTCNLTGLCDVNCCCDTDCTLADKQTFSTCIATYQYENSRSCAQSAVLYRNFTSYTSNTTSSDLLCVYFDRYAARNYYVAPSVVASDPSSVAAAVAAFGTAYTAGAVTSGLDPASVRTAYRTNVPVQVMYSSGNLTGFLAHPRAGNSPGCNYASPALFLDSSASACARQVTLGTCAASHTAINLASFVEGFRVASQPQVLDSGPDYNTSSGLISVTESSVQCLNLSGDSVNCTSLVPTSDNSTECEGVLSQLTFNVNVSASGSITAVSYDAVLITVSVSSAYTLMQNFSFNYGFGANSTADAYPRSGNPGYLSGRPVIAGSKTVNGTVAPLPWLSLPAVNADGSCGAAAAAAPTDSRSVKFGENLRASCTRSLAWDATTKAIPADACASLHAAIVESLAGLGVGGTTALATFGNFSASQPDDWFLVSVQNCNPNFAQVATSCTNMILGGRLEVLVARAGSLGNPQSKLVGAKLSCDRGTVFYQCAAGSCLSASSSMKFLTTYTVIFTDVSNATLVGAKQRPVYLLRLPTDFFYPLYTFSGAAGVGCAGQGSRLWLLLLLAVAGAAWRVGNGV